jgi:hypothetical protein
MSPNLNPPRALPAGVVLGIVMTGTGRNKNSNGRRRRAGRSKARMGIPAAFKIARSPNPLIPFTPRIPAKPPNPPSPPNPPKPPPSS